MAKGRKASESKTYCVDFLAQSSTDEDEVWCEVAAI